MRTSDSRRVRGGVYVTEPPYLKFAGLVKHLELIESHQISLT
jgi:hypothetical protein